VSGILEHLPGHNCGACGFLRCDEFAVSLAAGKSPLSDCAVLRQERYKPNAARIQASLELGGPTPSDPAAGQKPRGLIDGYEADFVLAPFGGEASCREILLSLTPGDVDVGDVIRYRPLGCPIVHFARIIEKRDGLLTVHIVGPRHRLGDEEFRFTDVGVCMVIGFEGDVQGALPSVGQTVRFMPAECMMQKVHSAVVVKCEGRTVRLEGLDLKVWAPPVKA
jgi:uncharacterized Fe-S cluster-containing protein